MALISDFLKRMSPKNEAVPRMVHIFVHRSRGHFVVAAMSRNDDAVYYEQPAGAAFVQLVSPDSLGQAFRTAFDRFSVAHVDLQPTKKSDWPAYKVSKAASVAEFERTFIPVTCTALNESNAVVRASAPHPYRKNVELSVVFNPLLSDSAIGNSLVELLEAVSAA